MFFLFVGCGGKFLQFGGKVTTPDGQPFTKGFVVFTNGKEYARGKLQSDGSYKLDSLKDGDGLTSGRYQVYLSSFQDNIGTEDTPVYKSDIDLKYENPDTSGLSCEVVPGGYFNFTVDLQK
ncbi:MAG: hypothetical protein LBC74_10055 [Planctomycetaceae bacterium]|jgi:hypothetical protein|nr:hypothetical protein [Planctomycetaceae bacterium]